MSDLVAHQPDQAQLAYQCGHCGTSGVRLFRPYARATCLPTDLRCGPCSAAEQELTDYDPNATQIGWHCLAVPTKGGYWGYTSVPDAAVEMWKALPIKASVRSVDEDAMIDAVAMAICVTRGRDWDSLSRNERARWRTAARVALAARGEA